MITLGTVGRVGLVGLAVWVITTHFRKHYWKHANPVSRSINTMFVLSATLFCMSVMTALVHPTTIWLRWATVVGMHQSALLLYLGIESHVQAASQPLRKNTIYLTMTVCSSVNLLLDYLRRDNLGSFVDNEAYQPTVSYYLANAVFYLICLVLSLILLASVERLRRQPKPILYQWRAITVLGAVALSGLAALIALANVLFSAFGDDTHRALLNMIYQGLKLPIGLLYALSSAPTLATQVLVRPWQTHAARRRVQQDLALRFLHERMIQVVPCVHLPHEELRAIRAPLEIDEAREVLWSHQPRTAPITARAEASLLQQLLTDQRTIDAAGPYQPPPTQWEAHAHNLAVAKLLQEAESR